MFTLKTRRIQPTEDMNKQHQKIGKKLDPTNLEDLLEYIQLFIHF